MIDHIWSNCPYNFNSGVIPNQITDHYVIFENFKLSNDNHYITKLFRDHSNIRHHSQSSIDIILNDEICHTNVELYYRISDFTNKLYENLPFYAYNSFKN